MARNIAWVAIITALLVLPSVVMAQYGYGTTTTQAYPNCNTCQYGTYLSNNAPTYWNCACTGALCTYTGQGNTVTSCSLSATTASTTVATTSTPTTTVQASNSTTLNSTANTVATTLATTVQTTTPTTSILYQQPSGYSSGLVYYGLIVIIALVAIYGLVKMPAMPTRLAVLGAALILIGTVAWLYGNYGGPGSYVLEGVAAIIVGLIIWIIGDVVGGTFKHSVPAILTIIGIIFIIAGTWAWYYIGSLNATWGGVAALVIGTFVWLYGDAQAGAFIMGKPKK